MQCSCRHGIIVCPCALYTPVFGTRRILRSSSSQHDLRDDIPLQLSLDLSGQDADIEHDDDFDKFLLRDLLREEGEATTHLMPTIE